MLILLRLISWNDFHIKCDPAFWVTKVSAVWTCPWLFFKKLKNSKLLSIKWQCRCTENFVLKNQNLASYVEDELPVTDKTNNATSCKVQLKSLFWLAKAILIHFLNFKGNQYFQIKKSSIQKLMHAVLWVNASIALEMIAIMNVQNLHKQSIQSVQASE